VLFKRQDIHSMSGRPIMMRAFILLVLCLAASILCDVTPACSRPREAPRAALVIANSAYRASDTPLHLPSRNADIIAEELHHTGFAVSVQENLDRAAMMKAISAFTEAVAPQGAALLFFSGYAIEAKGATYLIPVDAEIWTEADVRTYGISLEAIAAGLDKAGARTKLFVLDAARRNPFERRFRSLSAGVGPIALPPGSLLIASADVGEVVDAADGSSIFIGELAKEMRAPGLTADEVFNRTRIGVARATNGAQRPYVVSSLRSDFYFEPKANGPHLASSSPPGTEAGAQKSRPGRDAEAPVGPPPEDLRPGAIFRDCAECPSLVIVPQGEFNMGSEDFASEKPIHLVKIAKPFAIGRTEVTIAQWTACVADGGCPAQPEDQPDAPSALPVSGVSWSDARAYTDWLTRKTGHAYWLPSEAEWEYAARAGAATSYWWGADAEAGFANCRGCGGGGGRAPLPVASFQANPFGLYDTAGNVAEWVEDCWTPSYDEAPADAAPKLGEACKQRVLRGGSFDAGPRYARSASRFLYDAGLRYYANGFRVMRELP
jgi:formylglycine-generating enzyme required for sulfatase activity